MNNFCTIHGLGSYLPKRILKNSDLEKIMNTSDEWIVTRTGICERHILADTENTSDIAYYAAQNALEDAGIDATDITHIFVATCTPDMLTPSVACLVAAKLGLSASTGVQTISKDSKSITCFDFNAACSGFVYGLEIARAFLSLDDKAIILFIAAEGLSRRMNYKDRGTSILFGDGAGAVILGAHNNSLLAKKTCENIFSVDDVTCGADGDLFSLIEIGGGTSLKVQTGDTIGDDFFLTMQGQDVYKQAVRCMVKESKKILERNNLSINDIDLFIAHQANARIIEAVAERLAMPSHKVFMNLQSVGNTSAASIPLAMVDAKKAGLLQKNKRILLTTLGAGLTWGCALLS